MFWNVNMIGANSSTVRCACEFHFPGKRGRGWQVRQVVGAELVDDARQELLGGGPGGDPRS